MLLTGLRLYQVQAFCFLIMRIKQIARKKSMLKQLQSCYIYVFWHLISLLYWLISLIHKTAQSRTDLCSVLFGSFRKTMKEERRVKWALLWCPSEPASEVSEPGPSWADDLWRSNLRSENYNEVVTSVSDCRINKFIMREWINGKIK